MKLISIPKNKYEEYRLDVIFNGYKWDPQFKDSNTIAKYALVISEDEHNELKNLTERLGRETTRAEDALNNNFKLTKDLELPFFIHKDLKNIKNYEADRHIRLKRFDFHPTIDDKWMISEVNSDVPGGLAEASLMPFFAKELFKHEGYLFIDFGYYLVNVIASKVKPGGRIVLVHCTSYSDDRQVMQFLGDKLFYRGFDVIYAAADHLRFDNNEAICILDGKQGKVDAIFRFTPLEWLIRIKPKCWQGYFNTITPSCNHPVVIYTQTKRFPFVWNQLEKAGVDLSFWRELLPETIEISDVKNRDDYIYKPVHGRVGEKISIKEACHDDEYEKILKDVKRHPKKYIAQKKFISKPLVSPDGKSFHVCIGSFCVDGNAAGYYARISEAPRIDSYSADIPVLIEGENK